MNVWSKGKMSEMSNIMVDRGLQRPRLVLIMYNVGPFKKKKTKEMSVLIANNAKRPNITKITKAANMVLSASWGS